MDFGPYPHGPAKASHVGTRTVELSGFASHLVFLNEALNGSLIG